MAKPLRCAQPGGVGPYRAGPEMGLEDSAPGWKGPRVGDQPWCAHQFSRALGLMPDAGQVGSSSRGPRTRMSSFMATLVSPQVQGEVVPSSSWVKL